MYTTLTARKQLTAIFIGAALAAGCAPQEKSRQHIIRDEINSRLGVITEAQKPYWTSQEYELQKLIDKCSAENIAVYQSEVENLIDHELPKLIEANRITPERAERASKDLRNKLSMQSLAVILACQQGAAIPDIISDREPN